MPENFERSAVQLYSKIGQEPFVLAVGIVGACVRVCVCVCVKRRGGDTNYIIIRVRMRVCVRVCV